MLLNAHQGIRRLIEEHCLLQGKAPLLLAVAVSSVFVVLDKVAHVSLRSLLLIWKEKRQVQLIESVPDS